MEFKIEQTVIELIKDRIHYPYVLINNNRQRAIKIEYASDTYSYLEGFYSVSLNELICNGLKRGKLLKKAKKEHTGFKYFFNEDNEIILIEKMNKNIIEYIILCEKRDKLNIGYLYYVPNGDTDSGHDLNRIILSTSENNLTTMYSVTSIRPENIQKTLCPLNNMVLSSEIHIYQYILERVIKIIKQNKTYSCKDNAVTMNIIHEINIEPNNHIQNNNEANNLPVNELRFLKSRLKSDTPIHECINLFEEMCQIPLNDDLILYEGYKTNNSEFTITLIRQCPTPSGEYYQILLKICFSSAQDINLNDFSYCNEDINCDIFSFIRNSTAYQNAINAIDHKVEVFLDET